jgi:N-acetylmuramoyl-L-alanine amidase
LALVEAGWSLGDRLLMLTAPQQRGDDVAELQNALNQLGFDCGRPDGILGPATVRALQDFQRNSGLTPDGVCGPLSLHMIALVRRQTGDGPGVASVREHSGPLLAAPSLRVVVGQFGGMSTVARPISRALRQFGATVMSTDEYEAAAQAAAANRFGASVYVGFEAIADTRSVVSYFAVPTFESVGGRALATKIAARLEPVLPPPVELRGMRLPVLRETRMPAVLCSLGPVRDVVDATDGITAAVVEAVMSWSTVGAPSPPSHPQQSHPT